MRIDCIIHIMFLQSTMYPISACAVYHIVIKSQFYITWWLNTGWWLFRIYENDNEVIAYDTTNDSSPFLDIRLGGCQQLVRNCVKAWLFLVWIHYSISLYLWWLIKYIVHHTISKLNWYELEYTFTAIIFIFRLSKVHVYNNDNTNNEYDPNNPNCIIVSLGERNY